MSEVPSNHISWVIWPCMKGFFNVYDKLLALFMTGIFHIFLFGHLFFTGGGINFYMREACLDLPHCAGEASP